MIDFNDSVVYITARSPFARRVRLAFLEHGIRFEEKLLDLVKNPHLEYLAVNPVKRVPAVELKSGEIIVDSNQILAGLYEAIESPLRPRTREDQVAALRWSGIATGLCDRLVEYFFETHRPEGARDEEWIEEIHQCVKQTLAAFDLHMKGRATITSTLSQADLDMGTALEYLNLRYSRQWMTEYPKLAAYLASLQARASFKATQPPPPA